MKCEALFYSISWFLTLYTAVLPFNLVVRIFDIFFNEKFKILYRVALAILKIKEAEILACKSCDSILMILKNYENNEFKDEDQFIKIAKGFSFKTALIKVPFNIQFLFLY